MIHGKNDKKIKIGLPRALFYYNYYPFCKYFFEGLGAKVIVSEETNKELLQKGLKQSTNELCIPMKLLYAHIINLKDKVDYVFLPYIIRLEKDSFICPKLIASPDIIRNTLDGINLLTGDLDIDNFYSSLFESMKEIMTKLNKNPMTIYSVYTQAIEKQQQFEKYVLSGMLFEEAIEKLEGKDAPKIEFKMHKGIKNKINEKITLAIVGRTYIINDNYINSNLIEKLNLQGVKIITSDMVSKEKIDEELKIFKKTPHWTLANRVLGSALHFSSKKEVNGIIYITPFGCSPDSLMKEHMVLNIENKKPLLTLTIDEHTGEAGMVTRIEAFLDMIKRKKNLEKRK